MRLRTFRGLECIQLACPQDDLLLIACYHAKVAVQRPISPVLSVQDPHASAGTPSHVVRLERHRCRPAKTTWRIARIKIEDNEPARFEGAHDQIMILRHS